MNATAVPGHLDVKRRLRHRSGGRWRESISSFMRRLWRRSQRHCEECDERSPAGDKRRELIDAHVEPRAICSVQRSSDIAHNARTLHSRLGASAMQQADLPRKSEPSSGYC